MDMENVDQVTKRGYFQDGFIFYKKNIQQF